MEKILWHRRESRRKTEKTNIFLQLREAPAYSKMRKSETRNKAEGLEFGSGGNLAMVAS